MTSLLEDKTIVVIGGAGLIGSAISRLCAQEGAQVVIVDVNDEKGSALAEEISGTFEHTDLANYDSLQKLSERIQAARAVDGLVQAAYPRTAGYGKKFAEADMREMLVNLSLHVGGCLASIRAFSPRMQEAKRGSIVFLGSIYGVAAPRFELYENTSMTVPAEYAAAKGATISLGTFFASLLGKDGIRVNTISPGGVADVQPEAFVERYTKRLLTGNTLLAPEDIASAALFLLSDASRNITAQNIVVDGGWTA